MNDTTMFYGGKAVTFFVVILSVIILFMGVLLFKIDIDLNKLNFFQVPRQYTYYVLNEEDVQTKEYFIKGFSLAGKKVIMDGFIEKGSKDSPPVFQKSLDGNVLIFNRNGRLIYKNLLN